MINNYCKFKNSISCFFFHMTSGHDTKKSSTCLLLPNTHFCGMLGFEGIRFQTMCWASAAVSLPIIIANQYNTQFAVQQEGFPQKTNTDFVSETLRTCQQSNEKLQLFFSSVCLECSEWFCSAEVD